MCELNFFIVGLRDNNVRLRREFEMFIMFKGKLLVDIKNGFERVLRNEEVINLFIIKLSNFE